MGWSHELHIDVDVIHCHGQGVAHGAHMGYLHYRESLGIKNKTRSYSL